jgi:hypothetical protein
MAELRGDYEEPADSIIGVFALDSERSEVNSLLVVLVGVAGNNVGNLTLDPDRTRCVGEDQIVSARRMGSRRMTLPDLQGGERGLALKPVKRIDESLESSNDVEDLCESLGCLCDELRTDALEVHAGPLCLNAPSVARDGLQLRTDLRSPPDKVVVGRRKKSDRLRNRSVSYRSYKMMHLMLTCLTQKLTGSCAVRAAPVQRLVSQALSQSHISPFGKEQILESNLITYQCNHDVENRPR